MPAASAVAAVLLAASFAASGPAVVLRLQDPALLESSGLAVSARHPDVVWSNPDGGSVARVMAVDRSGDTVATLTLRDIDPYDPEALAPGRAGSRSLWVGDIGDNSVRRPDVSVFRISEPRRLADRTVRAQWFRFTYPDGPHDAEALLVDPSSGRVLIATKSFGDAGLYRAPSTLVPESEGVNRLERVADVPPLVTDGAFLPDGRFVLRTYTDAYVYDRPGHEVDSFTLPAQPQGESVAAEGVDALLVGSEGRRSAVYRVPLPATAVGSGTTQDSPDAATGDSAGAGDGRGPAAAESDGWRTAYLVVRAVAIVVILGGIVLAVRRRRR